jgi:hypothetical protein
MVPIRSGADRKPPVPIGVYRYCGLMDDDTDMDWLRRRLVAIEDERRSLPPTDLAARNQLAEAADACRAMLRSGNAEAVAAARERWSQRAANKSTHEQNVEALEAMARSMPGDASGTA